MSGLEHGFKAGVHLFFFDKLAALGCRYSFFHGSEEAGFFVEIPGNNARQQPLGYRSGVRGELRKQCLLLGGEMYFYGLQSTEKGGWWQELRRPQ